MPLNFILNNDVYGVFGMYVNYVLIKNLSFNK